MFKMFFSVVIYMRHIYTNHLVFVIFFTVIIFVIWGNIFMVWSKHLVPGISTLLTMFLPLGSTIVLQIIISSSTSNVLTWHTYFFMLMTSFSSPHPMIFANLLQHSLPLNLEWRILILWVIFSRSQWPDMHIACFLTRAPMLVTSLHVPTRPHAKPYVIPVDNKWKLSTSSYIPFEHPIKVLSTSFSISNSLALTFYMIFNMFVLNACPLYWTHASIKNHPMLCFGYPTTWFTLIFNIIEKLLAYTNVDWVDVLTLDTPIWLLCFPWFQSHFLVFKASTHSFSF